MVEKRGDRQGHLGKDLVCHMLEAYGEQLIILPPLWVLPSEHIDMKNQMGMTGSALSDSLKKVVKSHGYKLAQIGFEEVAGSRVSVFSVSSMPQLKGIRVQWLRD